MSHQVFYNLTPENTLDLLVTESVPIALLGLFLNDLKSIYSAPRMISCESEAEAKRVMTTLNNTYKMAKYTEPPSGRPEEQNND
ncbi:MULTISPECIES: hypothetical protein [Nostoc]|uniref:DUF2007 domain-containing protein n=1 Tax=Nostoc paludosum FACHB-159 TaxID=2692908 RepID=A0ABR8KJ17_9NOSO|nr:MULTISPECIES: hypothetical protein [Nostoc]MBD2683235.1 hypothetical protein [Nostoc sp. FACHB-857]MBD2739562.1 hypothetical protein [Nostoc paludosum FACHB-159]